MADVGDVLALGIVNEVIHAVTEDTGDADGYPAAYGQGFGGVAEAADGAVGAGYGARQGGGYGGGYEGGY